MPRTPATTPKPVIDLLYRNIGDILEQPDMVKQLFELGAEPGGNTPDNFAQQIATDVEKWRKVVKTTGVKVD
jgi:tripartite-type tricarboxylate transporter receptor subunit TctC